MPVSEWDILDSHTPTSSPPPPFWSILSSLSLPSLPHTNSDIQLIIIYIPSLPTLPIFDTVFAPITNQSPTSNKHIRLHHELSLNKCFTSNSLQTILMSSPPWTLSQPTIRLDLANLPPTNNTSYISQVRSLLNEYSDHILCLSDGSKSNHKTAYAYSIAGSIVSHRIRNIASVFTAELMAIFSCLSHITQMPPNNKYILLTDSLSSLYSLLDLSSTNPLTQRIHVALSSIASIDSCITFIWIPGHIGLPEHDAVDRAAKQATYFPRITDLTPLPATDIKIYYRTLILCLWNQLWTNHVL